jgi:hypothetical protein
MKSIYFLFLLSGCFTARSQAIGVFGGKSLMPAEYIAIQYFHPSNYPLQFTVKLFGESSKRNSLRYVSYGASFGFDYSSTQSSMETHSLGYRIMLGALIQREREPWVQNNQLQKARTGFGCMVEVMGVWNLSSAFSFCAFEQQRWLFKPMLGNRQFVFGMGLIYQLNSNY